MSNSPIPSSLLLISLSTVAYSNTDSNESISPPSDMELTTITAARTAQSNISNSIATIDDIDLLQANHINEILTQSPGTWISRGNGQESLTAIRSPVLTGGGSCNAFYVAEDNIPLRAPAFCNVNQLFDSNYEQAKSIEVLRGPGSAFQGNSAEHGVINILSPDFETQSSTRLKASYSSHQYRWLGIDHREDNWLLQAHATNDKGYKKDSGYTQEKLRFKGLQQGESWHITHNLNLANLDQQTAGYAVGKDAYKDPELKKSNGNPDIDAYRKAKSLRFSSDFRYRPKTDSEFILTPYLRTNEMKFLMHYLPGTPVEENGHHSLGLQSAFIRQYRDNIRLSSGFDIDYSRGFLKQTQQHAETNPLFPQGQQYDYDVNVMDIGMFVQADTQLSKHWELTTGLRLQNARYNYHNNLTAGSACSHEEACRYYRPESDKQGFFNWSPHVSLQYQYLTNNFSYIALSRGFRAPHTSDLYRLENGQAEANIRSEKIDSAELGFKGMMNNNLHYQISLFTMRKENVIIKTNQRERVDGQKTKHEGVELDLNYHIVEPLILSAAISYAKHQYNSNVRLFNSTTEDIKGNIIDTAPKQMYNVSLTWLNSDHSQLQLEATYLGSYYLDSANDFSYPGHTLTNIRYDHQLPKGWTMNLALINATDVDYAERADITYGWPGNPSEERYFIGEPRNIRISLEKKF